MDIYNIFDKNEFKYVAINVYNCETYYEGYLVKNILSRSIMCSKKESSTKKEKEIIYQVASGLTNREIAKELYITEYTVKKHITSIFNKLEIKNRSKAVVVYVQENASYI